MKRFTASALAATFLLLCTVAIAGETKKSSLDVKGMTCSGCARTIKSKVQKMEGISSIDVDVKTGKATIEYDPEKVSLNRVAEEINRMGFKASTPKIRKAKPANEPKSVE